MQGNFELLYIKRIAKVNYILLAFYICMSITSHAMANRLITVAGYPLFSSGLIYMAVFVMADMFASFNSRRFVISVIILEAFVNLFFALFPYFVNMMPYPDFFKSHEAYYTVFSPIIVLYVANLFGTAIASIVDIIIFSHLYKNKNLNFAVSAIVSSLFTVTCYTYITDYFGFRDSFPDHIFLLTHINIISNFVTLIIYATIAQFLMFGIQNYINHGSFIILNGYKVF